MLTRAARLSLLSLAVLILGAGLAALAQESPKQTAPPQAKTPDAVIKVSVKLVQVDATVTDEKGHPVRDLTAKDFEILQDGKAEIITNFSYVNPPANALPAARSGLPAGAPNKLRFEDVHRTVALVVDDIGLSFEDTAQIREALRHYVNHELQEGDLVAIVRTSSGMSALSQFTGDRRLLNAAIDKLRFNLIGGGPLGAFAPVDSHNANFPQGGNSPGGANIGGRNGAGQFGVFDQQIEYRQNFIAGSLGAVRYVVDGLRPLPGRKVLVLFSENAQTLFRRDPNDRVQDALQRLIDAANRSAVVIYGIDPGGLRYNGLVAADDTSMDNPARLTSIPLRRSGHEFSEREGLVTLAQATGGLFFGNSNRLDDDLRHALEDSAGYYLIGYKPEKGTFLEKTGRPDFHSLRVRVLRPGLKVRSRSGFFGVEDGEKEPDTGTPHEMMLRSLMSPFSSGDIHVRLTALFNMDAKEGPVLNSMLYIDPHELHFATDPDGVRRAAFEAMAATFDENGVAVDTSAKEFVLQAKDDGQYDGLMKSGVVYVLQQPGKKPGPYQMRVAVRDVNTGLLGSATEFIEVPNLHRGRLTLSSIMLKNGAGVTGGAEPDALASGRAPANTPAVRTFRPGDSILYLYQILNAHPDAGKGPAVEAQVRLFRDGQPVFSGKAAPPVTDETSAPDRLVCGGALRLGQEMKPGDYVLQIAVTDEGGKHGPVTQAVDFVVQ
jgi:VWFA-related protein